MSKKIGSKIGNQTLAQSHVLPYEKTVGAEAIKAYEKTGRKAQEWQELLIYDMMAKNEEELWMHTKFGYAVPRRNGKNVAPCIGRRRYTLMR